MGLPARRSFRCLLKPPPIFCCPLLNPETPFFHFSPLPLQFFFPLQPIFRLHSQAGHWGGGCSGELHIEAPLLPVPVSCGSVEGTAVLGAISDSPRKDHPKSFPSSIPPISFTNPHRSPISRIPRATTKPHRLAFPRLPLRACPDQAVTQERGAVSGRGDGGAPSPYLSLCVWLLLLGAAGPGHSCVSRRERSGSAATATIKQAMASLPGSAPPPSPPPPSREGIQPTGATHSTTHTHTNVHTSTQTRVLLINGQGSVSKEAPTAPSQECFSWDMVLFANCTLKIFR